MVVLKLVKLNLSTLQILFKLCCAWLSLIRNGTEEHTLQLEGRNLTPTFLLPLSDSLTTRVVAFNLGANPGQDLGSGGRLFGQRKCATGGSYVFQPKIFYSLLFSSRY